MQHSTLGCWPILSVRRPTLGHFWCIISINHSRGWFRRICSAKTQRLTVPPPGNTSNIRDVLDFFFYLGSLLFCFSCAFQMAHTTPFTKSFINLILFCWPDFRLASAHQLQLKLSPQLGDGVIPFDCVLHTI